MALNPDLPCSLFRRRGGTAVFAAMAICLGIGGQVLAQAPYDNAQTPEGWAWALIKQGKEADFNVRCGTTPALDPRLESESRWTDDCRRLSAAFLVDVLTSELLRKQVPFAGVNIVGARIEGDIELRNAKLDRALFVDQSRIENNISLYAARTDSIISFVRSRVVGTVTAELLHGEVSLLLRDTEFKQAVTLKYARVEGNVDMDGATVGGKLDATALQGGASLFMSPTEQNKSSFKQVTLLRAKIIGQVVMAGATFDGELNANSLHVGDALFMMSTAQNRASFKEVNLVGANVTSNVDMDDATFDGELNADSMQVGASLFMRGATGKKSMDMALARISGSLDMRGAILAEFDLSGTSIAGDLRLGPFDTSHPTTIWRTKEGEPGILHLRNTRIANLMDAEDAWPIKGNLHLDGFAFAHLGGFEGDTGAEMRGRGMDWWDDWVRRDPVYRPSAYEQLAAALTAAGDRAAAEEIRFFNRVRQRETEDDWRPWIFSGFLQYVAGFGIGSYTFRVLYWVIGISLAGAEYLRTCVPKAMMHGFVWCFGASLSRLLPVIEINKEFSDFFNDPNRTRLTAWQSFVFSVIGMVGWVLGAILLAAVSGLTQKS